MIDNTYQLERKPSLKLELLFFYLFFAAAIYFTYIQTRNALPFFVILLMLAWFSKKNYFWLAFFFAIISGPSFFFIFTDTSHLPLIKLMPGVSLAPTDCFTVLMALKVFLLRKRVRLNLVLKMPLTILFIYCIFSFFWGIMFHSETLKATISFIRPVTYFVWYLLFTVLIRSEENVFKFLRLIFPLIFFIIFTQFYFLSTSSEFINIFDPYARAPSTNSITGELRPWVVSIELILLIYIGSLLFTRNKLKIIDKLYMYLVGITAYLSIFISATRTLFALFTIIFMGVFSKTIKDAIRWAMMVLLIVLLMFALIKFEVISMDYLKYSAWGRVSQLAMFFEGRGGEIDTFGERLGTLEVLKEKISQSMILGYGFSTTSLTCVDNDWGAANTILVLGLVGLLLYILLFVSYFKMILSALGKTRRENRELLRVLLVSFIGMLGIYCFTWDFFTPLSDRKIAFMMVFFGISEILSGSADQSN